MTFQEAIEKFTEVTEDEAYDAEFSPEDPWMVEAEETFQPIEHFIESSKRWAEKSKMETGEINGLTYVYWAEMQANKGDRRQELAVVDFGDRRIAMEFDVTYY